ncbi:delta-aminolevulinic acid dehydratase [Schinkia azotoformans MEV2011]|uniref:Delta-aminolevulinic acid dehydratase n=1 Tax=Schinkia azotoformans MEV2011 TaxID=1348973 RepID=A0A072NQH3_SCHAZ|nr:delta-aminolevulinic acid dehydratase [Schinkia azotoformans MEV2011]
MNELNFKRHRRLRTNERIRSMVRETYVRKEDLIYPIFVIEGSNVKNEVPSMPGVFSYHWIILMKKYNQL